jgi:hypothetical protein
MGWFDTYLKGTIDCYLALRVGADQGAAAR